MTLAVLMPLHESDALSSFKATIDNVNSQSLQPDEIFIIVDGPVSCKTRAYLQKISSVDKKLKTLFLKKNVGLGVALNVGLRAIKSDLVVRVDVGDLSHTDRFLLQVSYLNSNLDVAALGSSIYEIEDNKKILVGAFENKDLAAVCKYRAPLFHPTVMYRRKPVIEVGGYPELRKAQDWGLWSRMCSKNLKLHNLSTPLVNMDVGSGVYKRRGLQQFKYEVKVLLEQRKIGFTTRAQLFHGLILRGLLRTAPAFIKKIAYRTLR